MDSPFCAFAEGPCFCRGTLPNTEAPVSLLQPLQQAAPERPPRGPFGCGQAATGCPDTLQQHRRQLVYQQQSSAAVSMPPSTNCNGTLHPPCSISSSDQSVTTRWRPAALPSPSQFLITPSHNTHAPAFKYACWQQLLLPGVNSAATPSIPSSRSLPTPTQARWVTGAVVVGVMGALGCSGDTAEVVVLRQ